MDLKRLRAGTASLSNTARKLQPFSRPTPAIATDGFESSPKNESRSLHQIFRQIQNGDKQGKARLLVDNTEAWNTRWKVLESATETINTQYFCWDQDIFGKAMLGHIFKKASQENVQTRIMVDASGDPLGTSGFKSHIGGKDYLQEVTALPNAEAKVYHPNHQKVLSALLRPGKNLIAASNHDKILEVDGQRSITGGRNIGYEYFADPKDNPEAWRDTDVYLDSATTAYSLRDAFEAEYNAPGINQKVRPDLFGNWVKRDIELLGAYSMMDHWLKGEPLSQTEKDSLRTSTESKARIAEEVYQNVLTALPEAGATREPGQREKRELRKLAEELVNYPELKGTYRQPESATREAEIKVLDRTSVAGTSDDQMGRELVKLIRSAKKKIVLENPYIVLTKSLLKELQDAGKRGVETIIGTNSPSSTDSEVTQAFFLEDWPKVLATTPNLRLFVATGERKLHAKTAVIDDEASLVSTYNLDLLSSEINSEVGALVWSKEFAADNQAAFFSDMANRDNGVRKYNILRDEAGTPIRSDGLPVLDKNGELLNDPEVTFGPESHLSQEVLDSYAKKRKQWNTFRQVLPGLSSLQTFNFTK